MAKTVYALQDKGRFFFICAATTVEAFEKKVQFAYSNWRGMQPKGTNKPLSVFMEKYNRVKVTVTVEEN